ncbi:MAG: hypothetical protein E7613_07400 [Ruminococcaceae bacterium]|nr:hypothetical protein [Oscillospiraceae bacterium]
MTTPANAPVKKKEFLKNLAPKSTKTTVLITWLVAVVCIALLALGAYFTLTNSVLDMPALDWTRKAIGSSDDIIEEFEGFITTDKNSPDNLYNYAKTEYEAADPNELTAEEHELAKTALAACEKFIDNPNILNTRAFYLSVLDCLEHENEFSKAYAEKFDYADNWGGIVAKVLLGIVIGVIALAALCAILVLISAKAKNIVGAIFALILSAIPHVLLVGIPFAAIVAVVHIVLIVLICVINGAYKKYKREA